MDISDIVIEQARDFSQELREAVSHLAKQEGKNFQPLSDKDLAEILHNPNGILFIARDSSTNEIAGMTFVAIYRIPYAKKAYIDDVVVDQKFRKRGIATKLLLAAIAKAKEYHVSYVMLTAQSNRVANNLYEKLGFTKRESNVYRLYL